MICTASKVLSWGELLAMEIVSVQNQHVKQWAHLLERSGREKYQQYLIEGHHLVEEAIAAHAPIQTIVYRLDDAKPHKLKQLTAHLSITWVAASEAVFAKCTDAHTPQSIFAVIAKPQPINAHRFIDTSDLVVVLDGIQDPGNLGTIIRSADAVGASAVILGQGTVDVYNPKTIRATMGSMFHVPIVEADLVPLLQKAKEKNIQLVTTSLQASTSCYMLDYCQPTWVMMGNEARGVSHEVAKLAHHEVIIPMHGSAESLNVAMATTVLLFEVSRQRIVNR